ncbi:MAG TPA: alpha/beta hydrolase [Verrucomicrobiales bacterium]|nr:alpha/beta hydrolase [Verrucomicrobiales bacterium]HIL69952.1 alpha/beta hydrolase [Verrucomicrobiota bacterium]
MRFGEIRNRQGERLDYTYLEGNPDLKKIVVVGHGVTGNKDRPFLLALTDGVQKAGLNALRFSFSGNGESEGTFVDSTISKEVTDLGSVLDAVSGYEITYVGHSMGGAVGVLRASSDDRIGRLISLAGMVHTEQFAQTEFGEEEPDKGCMWEEPDCPLSSNYMNDMAAIHSVVEKGSDIKVPWLLIHGTEDDVVPIQDSLDIFEKAVCPKELFRIEGANHVFSETHTEPMVQKVVEWVRGQFS